MVALTPGQLTPDPPIQALGSGKPVYVELTGSGSGIVTAVFQMTDGSYGPEIVGTDGSSAITLNKVMYAGSPCRFAVEGVAGQGVKVLADAALIGVVNVNFRV